MGSREEVCSSNSRRRRRRVDGEVRSNFRTEISVRECTFDNKSLQTYKILTPTLMDFNLYSNPALFSQSKDALLPDKQVCPQKPYP